MKLPLIKLREFIKDAAITFDYDFIDTASENYDYASIQYDSDNVEIESLDPNDVYERVVEIGFDFTTSHDVSAGGWNEEPCHDIELKEFTVTKIVFWYNDESHDFSDNRAAKTIIKNYMSHE